MTLTSRTRLRTEYIRRESEGSERDRERPRTSENQASLSRVAHFWRAFSIDCTPFVKGAEFVTKMYAGIERKFNQLLRERVQKSMN